MDLENLEIDKAIRDIKYWTEELEYKKILNSKIEKSFNDAVDSYINKNENLKTMLDNEKCPNVEFIKIEKENTKDSNIKKLYREIVKKSHPDKKDNMSDYFVKATISYENEDYLSILMIANDLDIDIKKDLDIEKVEKEIRNIKDKTEVIEKSIHWKWYKNGKDFFYVEKYVDNILFPFI